MAQVTLGHTVEYTEILTTLAHILAKSGDMAGAVAQQHKATELLEHLVGLDHFTTVAAHFNLAQYLSGVDKNAAVAQMRRVCALIDLAAGPHCVESVNAYLKMGLIYQVHSAPAR